MTNSQSIRIPDIIQRLSHDMYLEANTVYFYELFLKFWSRHGLVKGCACRAKDTCMLNFIFDTHMKAHRLVCACKRSCDVSISEMGAVAIGCSRAPLRSSSSIPKTICQVRVSIIFHDIITDYTFFVLRKAAARNRCKYYCIDRSKYGLEPNTLENSSVTQAIELEGAAEVFENTDDCTVHRDDNDMEYKRRTADFMVIVSNELYSHFAYKPPTNENKHQRISIVAYIAFLCLIFFSLSIHFLAIWFHILVQCKDHCSKYRNARVTSFRRIRILSFLLFSS